MTIKSYKCIITGEELQEIYLTRTTDNKFVNRKFYEEATFVFRKGILSSKQLMMYDSVKQILRGVSSTFSVILKHLDLENKSCFNSRLNEFKAILENREHKGAKDLILHLEELIELYEEKPMQSEFTCTEKYSYEIIYQYLLEQLKLCTLHYPIV